MLVVTPYYNKATQNGLIKMYGEIADKATAPVILYNVPSRTGVNIQPATVKALSEHPNISAIKEASGNISAVAEIAALCGATINIYSGNVIRRQGLYLGAGKPLTQRVGGDVR